ncbi:MAG: hypothetical protein J6S67_20020 [Methanobrevibacter sp.]|nr:hypothetical protein [Methanobrevibacter sp.]
MRTSKELSTISYNSPEFLKYVLDQMIKEELLSSYMFIQHLPEEDENKDHIHLWIKPNRLFDTGHDGKRFLENNPEDPLLPFGCIWWQQSQYDDWIPYDLHDPYYLSLKGQSRKYHYDKYEMICSNKDEYEFLYRHAFTESAWVQEAKILKDLDNGFDVYDLISTGRIPFSMSSQGLAYETLKKNHTFRNGRVSNH